jgi:D-alanyl-D-alanine carboxypeptidase
VKKRSALRIRKSPLFLLQVLVAVLAFLGASAPAAANSKYAAIVFDANSGETLFARNADARRYPASLTKMMTLYVLFEELDAGRIELDTAMKVSATAAGQSPSKLGLRKGTTITAENALLGLVTKSANDAAVVIAEHISGSVSGFASRMNRTARALGMTQSTFKNPNGLPNSAQVTSARDMVVLALALQERFPTYYKYFSKRSFTFRGKRYRNHNRLLGNVEGVDGIKTGYTRASGFNLVTNIHRDGRHIIAVVMGGKSAGSRDAHMRELIAKYLPRGSRTDSTEPLVIADIGTADTDAETAAEAIEIAAAGVPIPRARPTAQATPLLSYAPAENPRDLVSAAMASAAPVEEAQPMGDAAAPAETTETIDPIAARIAAATEVAALAVSEDADPTDRLAQLVRIRAGGEEIIAAAALPGDARSDATSEAGWHIQIGAVPTQDGAEALIERAQNSLGPVLASLSPLTQPVERNGETLYRARFAGFSDKEEARETCAKLKSKSFACLAVPN